MWVLNFAISEGLLFVTLMAYIVAMGATGGAVPIVPVLAVGFVFAIGAPIAFYPFSAGAWAAAELIMHPERAIGSWPERIRYWCGVTPSTREKRRRKWNELSPASLAARSRSIGSWE